MTKLTGIYDETYAQALADKAVAQQGREGALAWAAKMAATDSAERRNFCPKAVFVRVSELLQ